MRRRWAGPRPLTSEMIPANGTWSAADWVIHLRQYQNGRCWFAPDLVAIQRDPPPPPPTGQNGRRLRRCPNPTYLPHDPILRFFFKIQPRQDGGHLKREGEWGEGGGGEERRGRRRRRRRGARLYSAWESIGKNGRRGITLASFFSAFLLDFF